jgi:glycosyltransferase involved in cell wall biosynthesis
VATHSVRTRTRGEGDLRPPVLLSTVMSTRDGPFRIAVSSVAVGGAGGTFSVLEGLGSALAALDDTVVRLAVRAELAPSLRAQIPSPVLVPVKVGSMFARLKWEERELPRMARNMGAHAVLGLTNTLPIATPMGAAHRAVLVQNIAPLLPDVRRMYGGAARGRLEVLRFLTLRSVRRADVAFLFTRYGRALVSSFAPRTRIVAIPPGGLATPPVLDEERSIDDHMIVLADLYRYKGVEDAIKALADPRLRDMRLIVAGAPMDRMYVDRLRALRAREGVTNRVSFVGRLPRPEAIRLLRSARCLVQPSRVESLALPMLEAFQLGVPVVSTDIPVARELCGDGATYYPPGDMGTLVSRLLELPAVPAHPPFVPDWATSARALVSTLREHGELPA